VSTDPSSAAGAGPPSDAVEVATAALRPHDRETEEGVRREMDAMYRRDRLMAIAFVVALLVVLPFILVAMWGQMPDTATKLVLVAAALVLALYNCASMLVLVRNYSADRDFIYRRDIAHLRLLRATRKGGG
jgi:phosphatidylglycerophosphate synthase